MNITKQRTESYKKAHLKEFGVKLDNNKAFSAIHNLTGFYKTLMHIAREIQRPAFLYRVRPQYAIAFIEKIE